MFYQLGYDKACKDVEAIIQDKYDMYTQNSCFSAFDNGWCSALTAILRELPNLAENSKNIKYNEGEK